jgi:hypothetical protein
VILISSPAALRLRLALPASSTTVVIFLTRHVLRHALGTGRSLHVRRRLRMWRGLSAAAECRASATIELPALFSRSAGTWTLRYAAFCTHLGRLVHMWLRAASRLAMARGT